MGIYLKGYSAVQNPSFSDQASSLSHHVLSSRSEDLKKKKVNITVKNYGKDNMYIKSMKLNGKELSEPFFSHADIVDGADFEFEMSATPTR